MGNYCRLYLPQKDGSFLINHCKQVEEVKGEWPKEFPLPEISEIAFPLWNIFWDMRSGVPSGFNGAECISHTEMQAWSNLYGIAIPPDCVRMIRMLDNWYLNHHYSNQKKISKTK